MYKCEIFKSSEVDNYEHGCTISGGNDFGRIDVIKATTISTLVEKIKSHYDLKDAESFENRIEHQEMETGEAVSPTTKEIELWKAGKFTMYLANYSFYFSEVTETEIFPSVMLGFFK